MANIRIKDLANTASSTASDDFIGIDGATNGTRKLNAYSPTFGGNATVGGALIVATKVIDTSSGYLYGGSSNNPGTIGAFGDLSGNAILTISRATGNDATLGAGFGNLNLAAVSNVKTGNVFQVTNTTASTSTSTGALVVSGGVGVAGAINAGGTLTVNGKIRNDPNTSISGDVAGSISNLSATGYGLRVQGGASGSGYILSANDYTGSEKFQISGAGNVSIPATTASTSTSTGALVVSGGVGVAGAINAGTLGLNGSTSGAVLNVKETAGVATAVSLTNRNSTQTWSVAVDAAAVDDKLLAFISGGSVIASLNPTDQSATFAGSVKTAAPAGGTAANWKLGTVATVSPTSPNRTIEVDIGGTIYYIHAKTTNN